MEGNGECVLCSWLTEDGGHLFFKYKYVREVWEGLQLEEQRRELERCCTSGEVIQQILKLKEDIQLKGIVLLWQWWIERNRVREGDKRRNIHDLMYVIMKNAEEFLRLGSTREEKVNKPLQRWCKPPNDTVKINSDGAFLVETGEGGWGYVIRDGDGDVLCAGAGNLTRLKDALQSEVRACLHGAKAAAEHGMGRVIMETDSLVLIQAMKDNSYRLSMFGGDILELKSFMREDFISCTMAFAPRSCNRVAHALAALGRRCLPEADLAWNSSPSCVEDLVANDIAESIS